MELRGSERHAVVSLWTSVQLVPERLVGGLLSAVRLHIYFCLVQLSFALRFVYTRYVF